MKLNLIYSEFLKGQWAIDVRLLDGFLPFINNLNAHDSSLFIDDEDEKFLIRLVDSDGSRSIINAKSFDSEANLFEAATEGSIAVIPLKGTMMKEDNCGSLGTESIANYIHQAATSDKIIGLVLDVDSGGGSVSSIAPIRESILEFSKNGKPSVAIVDLAASAAYYAASFCNHIMASNDISSEVGSIGVMMSFNDLKPYYEKLGVKFHTIYAPESTHKNQDFELALKGKYEQIQTERLSPIARKFMDDVRKNRGNKVNLTIPGILNGKMFYANEAKSNGLIDSIGNLDSALQLIFNISNLKTKNQ